MAEKKKKKKAPAKKRSRGSKSTSPNNSKTISDIDGPCGFCGRPVFTQHTSEGRCWPN